MGAKTAKPIASANITTADAPNHANPKVQGSDMRCTNVNTKNHTNSSLQQAAPLAASTLKPPKTHTIAKVAIPCPLPKLFDYALPKEGQISPGMRVLVPFGRRRLLGIVIETSSNPSQDYQLDKLKTLEIVDIKPLIDASMLDLLKWVAIYYHHPLGEVITLGYPKLLRSQNDAADTSCVRFGRCYLLTPKGQAIMVRAKKPSKISKLQYELLDFCHAWLQAGQRSFATWQLLAKGFNMRTINALHNHGYLAYATANHANDMPLPQQDNDPTTTQDNAPFALNSEQTQAVNAILQQQDKFAPIALEGVTGSGKTEVYAACAKQILAQQRQVLILVPEIGLAKQTLMRFFKRTQVMPQSYHSGMSDTSRLIAWQAARSGSLGLLIGTRSCLFTPMPNLGLIIIDEVHDGSYKQASNVRYHALHVALKRAKMLNIPIIMGSATLPMEVYHQVTLQNYQYIQLKKRATCQTKLQIKIIDMRVFGYNQHNIFTPDTRKVMQDTLDQKQQVLVFLNRRGYSPVLLCKKCGFSVLCPHCDVHMVYHAKPERLHCHSCDLQQAKQSTCPSCQENAWQPVGVGTQKLCEVISNQFAKARLVRIDRDSVKTYQQLQNKLAMIHNQEADIIVGTQMIIKGHDFSNVGLVVMPDADGLLYHPDFRASERMAQNLVQVSGRAGRGQQVARLVVQTHCPEHPVFNVLQIDYRSWLNTQQAMRQKAKAPPYSHLAILHLKARDLQVLQQSIKQLKHWLDLVQWPATLILIGPNLQSNPKHAGYYCANLWLQCTERGILHAAVGQIRTQLYSWQTVRGLRWHFDIDPIDIGA